MEEDDNTIFQKVFAPLNITKDVSRMNTHNLPQIISLNTEVEERCWMFVDIL